MNSEEDIAETESGSEFLPELCGVKRCKLEADNECDECNVALCSEHLKTTTCQNNHKPEVKRQEKSNNDFTSAASDPVLVGKMDLEKLLDDHADQVNAQNMYYQAYNETYFCEISEYGQRLDAAKEYAIAYLEIYLKEAEAPSVIERGRKRKRLSKEERHEE